MISKAKDLISLLRDGFLLALVFLLILFPVKFNKILAEAGFEEGSFIGLKWKSQVVDSQEALKKAEAAILDLQKQNAQLEKELNRAQTRINDPVLTRQLAELKIQNEKVNKETNQVQENISQTIKSNLPLVEKARSLKSLQVLRQIPPNQSNQ